MAKSGTWFSQCALGIGKWCSAIDDYSPALAAYMQRVGERPAYKAMRARA
jgi:glutathione S-transferase